ncbi:hypothetical protein EH223_08490 [candidate division KSB1 bacterium]|nr:MAG: hypothetical protein EH223_08490 [candidate division KSB1 bacterium]
MIDITKELDGKALRALQLKQRESWLYTGLITVPAAAGGADGATVQTVSVNSEADFLCFDMMGSYTTLILTAGIAPIIDDGVCHTSIKIRDQSGGFDMFEDFIPTNLVLTPGRERRATIVGAPAGLTVEPSHMLYQPMRFVHLFSANNNIQIEARNDSDTPNYIRIAFHGVKIRRQG